MPFNVPDQVGELFDLGIELRDPTQPLAVLNRTGQQISLTQVGYVCDPAQQQEESTELQRKQQVVQLGPTLMDREWESWPGQSQGSWASGLGQRIQFGGDADPAAYWDGLGVIWPITDWQPQGPFVPPAYTDAAQVNPGSPGFMGTSSGFLPGAGSGFASSFMAAGHVQLIWQNATGRAFIVADPIPALGQIQDLEVAHGYIWVIGSDAANQLSLYYVSGTGVSTKLATVSAATVQAAPGALSTGRVVNRQYVCTVARLSPSANFNQDQLTVWDVTSTTATPASNASTVLNAPTGWTVEDTAFLADDLVVSMSDGQDTVVAAWNIASQSWRTLTQIPGASSVTFAPIAGGLFMIARNTTSVGQRAIELYLLQNTSLQEYGPLIPQIGSVAYPYVTAISHPVGFGPYAVFAVTVQQAIGQPVTTLIYAYDVLRGRVFKISSLTNLDSSYAQALDRVCIAVFSSMGRTSPTTFNCQWGIALNINTATANSPNIQEFDIGIQTIPGTSGPLLQLPFDGTSGLVDFTSAVPKLFRQIQTRFSALPGNVLSGVTINVWLDQDPGQLKPVPDFTTSINGGTSPGAITLVLNLNQMATKIVYEIVTAGGVYSGGIWIPAPKLISVSTIAATGWVNTLRLLLSRNANTVAARPGSYVWDGTGQASGLDEVAAANFIKAIWRLRGGQFKATMPNGDVYNAQMQSFRRTGSRPWASSYVADSPNDRYETIIELQFREDV